MKTSTRRGGRLLGRVAIVTGGANGMGAAHGRKLAEHGASVVLTDVDPTGEVVATNLRDESLDVTFREMDVSSSGGWDQVVSETVAMHGRIDVLVNNAGVLSMVDAVDCDESSWQRTIDVNQKGVYLALKHVVPIMRTNGGGSIINVSSVYGLVGTQGYLAYCASKGAVTLMTKSAAATYGPDQIRVNSVHPGVIYTKMLEQELNELGDGSLDTFLEATPLRRGAEPSEVSACVLFLASDESSYVTGAEIVVDGGLIAAR